ncbi:uncharacterized protein VP01_2663g8 [Puccinia sorghi]|uniref:HECT-type E3 ubiquitin transferase n=1 Tax=Puccinia sorghi TaxID=27349 RepID=A0A0L6V3Z4_9BASI|nr:uncharacterized protein VP01_2663g8 [Puccinia sorghi]
MLSRRDLMKSSPEIFDSTVTWFWRAVRSFGQEERAKLLQFATGSSRVPLEGFGALQGAQGATKVSSSSMLHRLISHVWMSNTDFVFLLSCSFRWSMHTLRMYYLVLIHVSTRLSMLSPKYFFFLHQLITGY